MTELGKTGHRCRFLIVTQPRSGSYHLASLLGSAPDVTCLGEIYKPDRVELPADLGAAMGIAPSEPAKRDADVEAYLGRLLALCDTPVFGFKEFPSRLRDTGIGASTLRSRRWQKIFLMRNPLRKYLSLHRARETGSFTKRSGDTRPQDNAVIRFDPAQFEAMLAQDRFFRDSFRQMQERRPKRVTSVDYRELNDPAVLARLLDYISSEGDAAALSSSYFRQNTIPLDDSFENFAEMRRYMQDHGHAALLEDAAHPNA
ncbi:hypothetical protein [Paracoccus sediminicola]|uniref:hypothetical protein n=1 Tax=Paracoccus sediminicola TaxID=3017783 RepID=UPI0022EFE82A|nr:hypothetical protein [Paracoccus sediminicola]WBU55508.1 hypothetical protein PAF18_08180 [Paracoccus sediminicola]